MSKGFPHLLRLPAKDANFTFAFAFDVNPAIRILSRDVAIGMTIRTSRLAQAIVKHVTKRTDRQTAVCTLIPKSTLH